MSTIQITPEIKEKVSDFVDGVIEKTNKNNGESLGQVIERYVAVMAKECFEKGLCSVDQFPIKIGITEQEKLTFAKQRAIEFGKFVSINGNGDKTVEQLFDLWVYPPDAKPGKE